MRMVLCSCETCFVSFKNTCRWKLGETRDADSLKQTIDGLFAGNVADVRTGRRMDTGGSWLVGAWSPSYMKKIMDIPKYG